MSRRPPVDLAPVDPYRLEHHPLSEASTAPRIISPPHPAWCIEEHPDAPGAASHHRAPAGAFRQPALHTRLGRLLRPERGLIQVELRVSDDAAGRRDEEGVTVLATDGATLDLTNGEARRLAALLTAAANRLDGLS